MGCDIRDVVQVKLNNEWTTVDHKIFNGRNYQLFSLLAGVRGTLEPISEPKGLPEGFEINNLNQHNYQNYLIWLGEHNFSYYTLKELKKYLKNTIYSVDCEAHKYLEELENELKKVKKEYKVKSKEVRYVFGFDS